VAPFLINKTYLTVTEHRKKIRKNIYTHTSNSTV